MLAISPEQVCFIIVKARALSQKEGVVDPDPASNPSDDQGRAVLEDLPGDATRQELAGALEQLNADEQLDLVALTWIGRGEYAGEEWAEARRQADDIGGGQVTHYLMESPLLGDLLEEGLYQLGYSFDEGEPVPPPP